jgi:hypothetical protein
MNLLKLTDPMMRGPAVTRLQEALAHLNHDLGNHGVDGAFGPDTEQAVRAFQKAAGITVDGIVGPGTWAALEATIESTDDKGPPIIDIRKDHGHPRLYSKSRSPRSWTGSGDRVVRGVTLHQTGIRLSERPRRWYTLNAHIGVLANGTILIVNDPLDFIWHAQGLSRFTIGIEFNGNFEGVRGRPDTLWKGGGGPHFLTPAQLKAADTLFEWLKQMFDDNGSKWEVVHAHRQSSKYRRSDPGSEIWQKVGIPWRDHLGATDGGPVYRLGDGRAIPKEWDSTYKSDY